MIARQRQAHRREPTIALINVVFLMLIFFMVAGTLAPPLAPDLSLVKTRDLDPHDPPDAIVVLEDGTLMFRGMVLDDLSDLATPVAGAAIQVMPDRDVAAARLLEVADRLRAAGAKSIHLIAEADQ